MDVNGNKEVFMYRKKKGQAYYTNRHSCFLLQYHMVFVTKYRKPVLTGEVKDLVYRIIRQVCEEKGLVVLELNGGRIMCTSCLRQTPLLPLDSWQIS